MAAERVAVVTGAGSGIGRAVALLLLAHDYRVVLAGRRAEALEESLVGAQSRAHALAVPTDVTDPDAVRALFDATVDRFDRVDVLFNNAGSFGRQRPLDEVTDDEWRAVVDVNLTGAFLCAREAFRVMRAQLPRGGRIINNGSVSSQVPRPQAIAYTATKHAITGLTKAIALEGRALGIACGQIDIGNVQTELAAGFGDGALQADGSRLREPLMDVEHAAEAVRHMADLPLDANIQHMTLLATGMPFVGRG